MGSSLAARTGVLSGDLRRGQSLGLGDALRVLSQHLGVLHPAASCISLELCLHLVEVSGLLLCQVHLLVLLRGLLLLHDGSLK